MARTLRIPFGSHSLCRACGGHIGPKDNAWTTDDLFVIGAYHNKHPCSRHSMNPSKVIDRDTYNELIEDMWAHHPQARRHAWRVAHGLKR